MLKYYDRLLRFKKKKSAGNSALILSKNNGAEMENGAQKSIFYKKKGERTDDFWDLSTFLILFSHKLTGLIACIGIKHFL